MKTWIISLNGRRGSWADLTMPAGCEPLSKPASARYARKLAELRRTGCRMVPGDCALVYATSPTKAIIGQVFVRRVRRVPVAQLVEAHERSAHCVRPSAVRAYAGALDALTVIDWVPGSAYRYVEPLSLANLRRLGMAQPPQTWCLAPPRVMAAALPCGPSRVPIFDGCGDCGGEVLIWTQAAQVPACAPEWMGRLDSKWLGCPDCCEAAQRAKPGRWYAFPFEHGSCTECGALHSVNDDQPGISRVEVAP